jgi:hypothetical protein
VFGLTCILLSIPIHVRSRCGLYFLNCYFNCFHLILYFNIRKQSDSLHSLCKLFFNVFNTMNNYVVSVFCLLGNYFCALYAVANHCSISIAENIIMFGNTYGQYTKINPGFQIILLPPPPIFAQGGRGVHKFCIYFWKSIKKDVAASWKG